MLDTRADAQATRSASRFSAHDCTLPCRMTALPSTLTVMRRASTSALPARSFDLRLDRAGRGSWLDRDLPADAFRAGETAHSVRDLLHGVRGVHRIRLTAGARDHGALPDAIGSAQLPAHSGWMP